MKKKHIHTHTKKAQREETVAHKVCLTGGISDELPDELLHLYPWLYNGGKLIRVGGGGGSRVSVEGKMKGTPRRNRKGGYTEDFSGYRKYEAKGPVRKAVMQRAGREGGWLEDKMRGDDEREQSQAGKLWRRKCEREKGGGTEELSWQVSHVSPTLANVSTFKKPFQVYNRYLESLTVAHTPLTT